MRYAPASVFAVVGLAIGACAQSGEAAKTSALNTTGADCTGHFEFDTPQSGSGQSDCGMQRGVAFRAKTTDSLAAGLFCNYTLNYASQNKGTGELACSDGSAGTFAFQENSRHSEGAFSVKLKDGRTFQFTYNTSS
jgi:hypothetical protein